MIILLILNVSIQAKEPHQEVPDFSWIENNSDYVNVSNYDNIRTSLRYATTNNFIKKNVYGEFHSCFLHRVAAANFLKATKLLARHRPGWKFLVFDCLRPRSIQKKFYAFVKGTSQQPYVANPVRGSIHNYGFAIDLSLVDEFGNEIDMGTGFDDFSKLSEPRRENQFLASGDLSKEQIANRYILRDIMQQAGFIQLANEWWHYDALPKKEVRSRYKIVE